MSDFIPPYHYVSVDTALEFIDTLETEQDGSGRAHPYNPRGDRLVARARPAARARRARGRGAGGPETASDRALARIRRVREALREIVVAAVEHRPAAESGDRRGEPGDARPPAVHPGLRTRVAPSIIGTRATRSTMSSPGSPSGRPAGDQPGRRPAAHLRERHVRWVFYDSSRTGRRRWCDMITCGNRAKAARHRARAPRQRRCPPDLSIDTGGTPAIATA